MLGSVRATARLAVLLPAALLLAIAAGADSYDPASEVIVTVSRHRFDPATVEVRRGVRVTFHCLATDETLTVVASDGSFESWALGDQGQWSHRFLEPGLHTFFVKEHPDVKGAARVE